MGKVRLVRVGREPSVNPGARLIASKNFQRSSSVIGMALAYRPDYLAGP